MDMTLIQRILMGAFDITFYIIISRKLLEHKNLNKKVCALYVLFLSLITAIVGGSLKEQYDFIITSMIVLIMTYNLYKRDILETIYLYVLSLVIIIFIQFFTVFLLEIFTGRVNFSFFFGMVSQSMSLFMVLLISKYLPINLIFLFTIKNNKTIKILTLNLLCLSISILFYWYIDMDGILRNIISMLVLFIGIIFVNFVLFKKGLSEEYMERQLQVYEKYLPIIDQLIEELRKQQHEYDNHIQALKMLTTVNTDYESIIKSMLKYTDQLEIKNDLGKLIKLDNKVLAGIIYSKQKLAEKKDIHFEIVINDYNFSTRLLDYELVEVIGNLINNAFETEVEDNTVKLILSKNQDMDIIEVRNKYPYLRYEVINNMFKKGFSTKEGKSRGYGLHNIKEIIEKHKGEITVSNEKYANDNYVAIKIIIKN